MKSVYADVAAMVRLQDVFDDAYLRLTAETPEAQITVQDRDVLEVAFRLVRLWNPKENGANILAALHLVASIADLRGKSDIADNVKQTVQQASG